MSYTYEAPIPGSAVRQDYLVGNRLLRAIWGFTNRSSEVDFTVYLAEDTHENWPDREAPDMPPDATIAFEIDGKRVPLPGRVCAIRRLQTYLPGSDIDIWLDDGEHGRMDILCWAVPGSRTLCIGVNATDVPDAKLIFGRVKEGATLYDNQGSRLDPSQPIPPAYAGKWSFCMSWEQSAPEWATRQVILEEMQRIERERPQVLMDNRVLSNRANTIAATLEVSRRMDGRLPAGAHRAYDGAWIRDGVMDCIGMIYAGCPDMDKTLEYLLRNVPPKEGQLEEYGMMVYGLHHYFLATGDGGFIETNMPYLKRFVHDVISPSLVDPPTGLLASGTEGYWERNWLGRAAELSQNAWAVIAVRCYTELGKLLGWEDDYAALNATADDLWERSMAETGFVREGRFVKRLFPGGEHQAKGLVRRGLSMGGNPYKDQFARPEDHEEVMEDLDPDVQTAVPWLWGLVDPQHPVCLATAREIWKLWNEDWDFGGLERYNAFADCDRETAGPWFLASMMAARAFLRQDDYEKASKIIEWTDREFLGSGWSERISRAHPADDPERYVHEILNWPGGEYLMLVYREAAGLYPTANGLAVRPHLPPDFAGLSISGFRHRDARYNIRYHGIGSRVERIEFNGRPLQGDVLPVEDGEVDVQLVG